MKNKDPLLSCAARLLRCFEAQPAAPDRQREAVIESVSSMAGTLERQLTLSRTARSRCWVYAAERTDASVSDALRRLHYAVSDALNYTHPRSPLPRPTLRDVYNELTQLHQEFDQVRIDDPEVLAVITPAIELEGIYLGEFSIELHLRRLIDCPDVRVFEVIARDPHPAAGSSDTTHPHVRDGKLCAGDATVPIAHALREGRLCDAFLAVNAVLNHYNPGSPYVRLDEWDGTPCADCGQVVDEEHRFHCDDCDQDYCDECFSYCDVCQTSCCRGCLEEDRESERQCCAACRHRCDGCGRTVDADSYVEETGLCPGCHEEYLQEQEEEVEDEHNAHEHDPGRATTDAVPGGAGETDVAA